MSARRALAGILTTAGDTLALPASPGGRERFYKRKLARVSAMAQAALTAAGPEPLALLKSLEWSGWRIAACCPSCDAEKYRGAVHNPGCALEAAITAAKVRS